jgi:hypothetical protein
MLQTSLLTLAVAVFCGVCCFENWSWNAAQAGLELKVLSPQYLE